jgi:hypothetical protein
MAVFTLLLPFSPIIKEFKTRLWEELQDRETSEQEKLLPKVAS